MINFFANQKKQVTIQGKGVETMVFSRPSRTTSVFKLNNVVTALLDMTSKLADGDTVTEGDNTYFAVAITKAPRAVTAQLYKANASISVNRIVKVFVDGTQKGYTETVVATIPALQEIVTVNMKQFDAGLLPNTVRRFLLAQCDVELMDRIRLGSEVFQVDAINDTNFPGLLSVQCSIDKRVVK